MTDARRWRDRPIDFLSDVLTLDDGRSYGQHLDGWQRDDFADAFANPTKHLFWERPRGHSKTADAAALTLHHLLSAPGRRAYFAAVDRDQAALAHDSIRGFIQRSPLLSQALRVDKWKVIAPSIDSTLEVLSADAPSSWGLRPSLVVADELHAWRGSGPEELFYSLLSALGKVPGARMVVATTAGWDRSSLAWKLREVVRDDPAWLFSRRGQCASWVSADFLEQQRRLLPDHVYRRLHDNEWTESGGAYLTYAEVLSIFDDEWLPTIDCTTAPHFLGLDIGLSNDATVAAIVHAEHGHVWVDELRTWQGSPRARVDLSDVEQWIANSDRHYFDMRVVADPWQAVSTLQRLKAVGVRCEDVTFSQQFRGRLFANLLELIRTARLTAFPHETLKDELLRLEFREVSGNLRVDHPSGGHDDHAVACAIAALAAVEAGARRTEFEWV